MGIFKVQKYERWNQGLSWEPSSQRLVFGAAFPILVWKKVQN
jgi:hypothetical protein